MSWKTEWKPLAWYLAVFFFFFFLPVERIRFESFLTEPLALAGEYAREHVVFCLVPAFLIAGAICVFISQASVIKYLGANAKRVVAYSVASVSGSILAVCSCTVLPLFAGIYRMGAGLGPATTFLYSGPAINVLAIILTARVLGLELGIARAVGAVVFGIVVGLVMSLIFRREEMEKAAAQAVMPEPDVERPVSHTVLFIAALVAILVFANWGRPGEDSGFWHVVYSAKWVMTSLAGLGLAAILIFWFSLSPAKVVVVGIPVVLLSLLLPGQPMIAFGAAIVGLSAITSTDKGETGDWFASSWGFAKQILPLLFYGILIAGVLLGRPDHEGLIPSAWISSLVGGNSLFANLFASVVGAFMYFATLTEVPILQGLIGSGMGKGPALALLLAGPALSLPNMLVIRSVMGTKKTIVYVTLVVVMATVTGLAYGAILE
jgi:hypothetical protein